MKERSRDFTPSTADKEGLTIGARGAFTEFDSIPQTTCFGLRRKAAKNKRSTVCLKETLNLPTKQEEVQKPRKQASDRLCGAGAILRSFSSIGNEVLAEAAAMQERTSSLVKSDPKALDLEDEIEAPSSSAKIMASYENLNSDRTDQYSPPDSQRDGDRDDGADSIDCEEEVDTFDVPLWRVDPHDIYFVSKGDGSNRVCRLGKGDFGPVYLGVWQDQEVAVKLARQKPIMLKAERQFQANVAKLYGLNHPNLVQFMGACCWKGGRRSVLVTEYMDKGDLRSVLGREDLRHKLAWSRHGQTVALDIANGLAYLHGKGVVHGRLKSSNILMNRAGVAKITDAFLPKLLSHCKYYGTEKSGKSPTPAVSSGAYLAPEMLAGEGPSTAADVYAFGVIIWELLTKEKPSKAFRSIRTPEEAPARIAYLVECCLAEDPNNRPTADNLISVITARQ